MLNAKWSSSWGGYSNFVVESCGYSDTLDMVNLSVIHNQMIETNGLCNFNTRQYFLFAKSWWIKTVNVENSNECVWLSGLFCAIIRANLLTFHFIPGKFGANNRVVWLSMVWLSGLCCNCSFKLVTGSGLRFVLFMSCFPCKYFEIC